MHVNSLQGSQLRAGSGELVGIGTGKVVQVVAWVLRVKNPLKAFLKTEVMDGEKDAVAIFSQGLKNYEQHPKAGQETQLSVLSNSCRPLG